MRVPGVVTALLIATIALGASAQKKTAPKRPPASDPCDSRQSQLDFTRCAQKGLAEADVTLAKTYAALLKDLDDDHRPILRRAEQAWEAYRDAECELQASENLGGSMYAQVYDDCRSAMADDRVATLQQVRKDLADFIR